MSQAAGTSLDSALKRKRRRNSSPDKKNEPDGSILEANKKIGSVIGLGSVVLFADRLLRLCKPTKMEVFQLVITMTHMYLFRERSASKNDCFALKDIEQIGFSHQSDNFLILKRKNNTDNGRGFTPDIVLVARRKVAIGQALMRAGCDGRLRISVTDRATFTHVDGKKYTIIFTRSEYGVQTSLYLEKDKDKSDLNQFQTTRPSKR